MLPKYSFLSFSVQVFNTPYCAPLLQWCQSSEMTKKFSLNIAIKKHLTIKHFHISVEVSCSFRTVCTLSALYGARISFLYRTILISLAFLYTPTAGDFVWICVTSTLHSIDVEYKDLTVVFFCLFVFLTCLGLGLGLLVLHHESH